MNEVFELTPAINLAYERVVALELALPKLLEPRYVWQRSYDVRDIVEFLRAIADARETLTTQVHKTYPETKSRTYTVTSSGVSVADDAAQAGGTDITA